MRSKKELMLGLRGRAKAERAVGQAKKKKNDVDEIRTHAPEGRRFLVFHSNHFVTTPHILKNLQSLANSEDFVIIRQNFIVKD